MTSPKRPSQSKRPSNGKRKKKKTLLELLMIPNTKKFKLVKLTPSKRIWSSEPEETPNPFGKTKGDKTQQYATYCFKVPLSSQYVETIYRDGHVVWERVASKQNYNSAIIGGGGRFFWRRRWFSRKIVSIEIEFHDIPLKNGKDPLFEISVRV